MRRIVTVEEDGCSKIAIDEEVSTATWYQEIWAHDDVDQLGSDPGVVPRELIPEPGQTRWRMVSLPPLRELEAEMDELRAEGIENPRQTVEVDADGWHKTPTLDYVLIFDGPVELVLEDGSVMVQPGDTVVQRATNHAWRNHGDKPIRLLAYMTALR
ncbi:hypothetical protein NOCA250003 [metagenome]|uniref:Cupin type-2 domain-containing protein n=1 Tax=metagenome TaxID=256318 RepID=A0A2P2C8K8_9ZZZZ